MLTCFKCFGCRKHETTLIALIPRFAIRALAFFKSKVLCFKILIIEAVVQEVQQDPEQLPQHLLLSSKFNQMVVGSRKEFNKNLANNSDTRFFHI